MLRINKTLLENLSTGQLYVRYTPVLEDAPGMTGKIAFATWDCEVGHPQEEHDLAIDNATRNAKAVLARIIMEI
jgi:hypothetical protein